MLLKYKIYNKQIKYNIKHKKVPQKTQILINSTKYIKKYIQIKNNIIFYKNTNFCINDILF